MSNDMPMTIWASVDGRGSSLWVEHEPSIKPDNFTRYVRADIFEQAIQFAEITLRFTVDERDQRAGWVLESSYDNDSDVAPGSPYTELAEYLGSVPKP